MAENYKHLYEQTKKMLTMYQDELIPGFRKQIEDLEAKSKWIPVTERLPEPETEVLVLAEREVFSFVKKCMITQRIVTTAMHEDGYQNIEDRLLAEDSLLADNLLLLWWETDGFAYNEELDAYIIPEGWLERKHYVFEEDQLHLMDDVVTHWMPLPKPPKEDA